MTTRSKLGTVRVLTAEGEASERWEAEIGTEGVATLSRIQRGFVEGDLGETEAKDAAKSIVDDAARILGHLVNPRSEEPGIQSDRTIVAVGQIQSGKTGSMNAVTALARDNGFDIVIVLGGTSTVLLGQTKARLEKALGLNDHGAWQRWKILDIRGNPNAATDMRDAIALRVDTENTKRPTLLLPLMKQYANLSNLLTLLQECSAQTASLNALVIDDEADQAGLNIGGDTEEDWSTVYSQLVQIRQYFKSVSTVQYTATPQALLVLGASDELSPEAAFLLDSGEGYTGGETFFGDFQQDTGRSLIEVIPDSEEDDMEEGDWETDSLQEALALFWVGCALDFDSQRQMLVHPSRLMAEHTEITHAINRVKHRWLAILEAGANLEESSESRVLTELQRQWLRPAYDSLIATAPNDDDEVPWEKIVSRMPQVLNETRVLTVNSETPAINGEDGIPWNHSRSWILVGGQKLDRGFTIPDLTVTHMARSVGANNVDTIQQRARFFGYRRRYIHRCRVWLGSQLKETFEEYVRHEQILRDDLQDAIDDGSSLREWRRRFVLGGDSNLTRSPVIRRALQRAGSRGFSYQRHPLVEGSEGLERTTNLNREVFEQVSQLSTSWEPWDGLAADSVDFFPEVSSISALEAYKLLDEYRVGHPSDGLNKLMWSLILREFIIQDGEDSEVQLVRFGNWTGPLSNRGLEPDSKIRSVSAVRVKNLTRGPGRGGSNYPGDRYITSGDRPGILLYRLDLTIPDDSPEWLKAIPESQRHDVPVIALMSDDHFKVISEADDEYAT